MQQICNIDQIDDGDARGFDVALVGKDVNIICVRQGQRIFAYRNSCPHTGINLEWLPDQFLDDTKQYIVCSSHGALFQVEDGHCVAGPCAGDALEPVATVIENGIVLCDVK